MNRHSLEAAQFECGIGIAIGDHQTIPTIMAFERAFGEAYSVREKYFYILLRSLWLSKKSHDGWAFFRDSSKSRPQDGFRFYGLSARVCKLARQKLRRDGLLECRYVHGPKGHRIGTAYRLLDAKFTAGPKAIHAVVMGQFGKEVMHSSE